MIDCPVHITVKRYSGKDSRKKFAYQQSLELASRIQQYLDSEMKNDYMRSFEYFSIAEALGVSKKSIFEILYRLDGGNNGITVRNMKNKPPKEPD